MREKRVIVKVDRRALERFIVKELEEHGEVFDRLARL